MIKAAIEISSYVTIHMKQDELQDYVLSSLSREISKEISKNMTVNKTHNPTTDSITYTGTLATVGANTVTVSGFNGTTGPNISGATISTSPNNYSQINLRVVEYTKNGKVTRVELQKYDESNDDWLKIPRLQIEE